MTYFMAWIIIGVCLFLLNKNAREATLPKYHLALSFIHMLEREYPAEYNSRTFNLDMVKQYDKILPFGLLIISVALAPLILFITIYRRVTVGTPKFDSMRTDVDEMIKKYKLEHLYEKDDKSI